MHKAPLYLWQDNKSLFTNRRVPSSDKIPQTEWETTGLYAMRRESLIRNPHRTWKQECLPCYVSAVEAIDINTAEDLEFARIVARGLG